MNISKAIELLQKDIDDPGSVDIMDVNKAEELGIEALERHQHRFAMLSSEFLAPLPGETKD